MRHRTVIAIAIIATLGAGRLGFVQAEQGRADNEIRSVIESQLDAFQDQDLDRAYDYAAPLIQRQFQNPDLFGQMVKQGYPMVWDPSSYEFLDTKQQGGATVQRLRLFDQQGISFIAEYRMEIINGDWRISGVRILREALVGA